MIKVTRLNGKSYNLNAIYIESVEMNPDTTITLINGKKYIVRESEDKVLQAIHTFYKSVAILGRQEMVGDGHEE